MPGINVPIGKKGWAVIIGMVGVFYWGEVEGARQERKAHNALIDPAAQVLLKKATFDLGSVNANDALLWSVFLPQARTCYECNALREYSNRLYYHSLPVVFHIRGNEVGETSDVGYTMVLGVQTVAHEGIQTTPQITYYIGHRSGSLARISEYGYAEYRVNDDNWQPAQDSKALIAKARHAFQEKWQRELATPRTQ